MLGSKLPLIGSHGWPCFDVMNEKVDMGNAFVKGGWEIGAGGLSLCSRHQYYRGNPSLSRCVTELKQNNWDYYCRGKCIITPWSQETVTFDRLQAAVW